MQMHCCLPRGRMHDMNDTYTINDQYTVQLADSKYIHDGVCGHNSLDTEIVINFGSRPKGDAYLMPFSWLK